MTIRFAQVALPLPVAEPYTYCVPDYLVDRVLPGARVVVPIRRREMVGIVTAVAVPSPPVSAREIFAAPDDTPALSAPLLALAQQASRYYGAPLGLMLRAMLPAPLWGQSRVDMVLRQEMRSPGGGTAAAVLEWLARKGGRASVATAERALKRSLWDVVDRLQRTGMVELILVPADTSAGTLSERIVTLTAEPLPLLERDRLFHRAPQQRRLYEIIEARGPTGRPELLKLARVSSSVLDRMVAKQLVAIEQTEVRRDPFDALPVSIPPPHLTPAQRQALEALDRLMPGESALLFGVTGSGKTLVYLEHVRRALEIGRGALILVPEIALTPQTVARVRGMFGDEVAVLHSGLSDGERADAWRMLQRGERRVAVGARSAVFAPVRDLGVIVLDEEHETSYKNGETPRYHAREIAAMRAQLEGAVLILGSATPSLESWTRHAAAQRIVRLPERIEGRPLPPVELIDLRVAPQVEGVSQLPWSVTLDDAVVGTLARGEQILLLLNRRGWSAFIQCSACGDVITCPNCSISLTLHHHPTELRCHYCDFRTELPQRCTLCASELLRQTGAGTQQLERLVSDRFPTARIARMDLDTTSGKWSHHRILEQVARREVDILLGTQMIAKGIDFPDVTLVGVVDADTALHLPDFRAPERTFQLIAQVAGRAGRGSKGGRVLVQTRQPEHSALVFAAAHDAEGFLGAETEARRSPKYPPHTSLIQVVLSSEVQQDVISVAASLADWSERSIARSGLSILLLGPAPCPIERIRERWRVHIIMKGPAGELGRWIRTAAPRLGASRRGVRIAIDRDPASLL